ncbi:MAG TPA: glycosyltransferase family 39 protein, partial [Candidatus Baltobacteraceae bacterium]|nr:glycosyltransferase family 39 protein [Candidatus Baltobacteraceae bacterium]
MDIRPTVRVAGFSHAGERLRWLALLALVAVAAGVWLRFSMLPTKYVYRDEVWTSMHIAGNSIEDVRALHVQNATAGDLVRTFQTPRTRGTADTVRALATTDPQHPPLYYLLARGWAGEGTSSITRERALSALFGILLIAAMYWLALALFKRTGTALLCAAFVAASPYQAVFSDEVREWSLFMLLAVIATALLVKALEASSIWNWVAYGVAMLLTAYCS